MKSLQQGEPVSTPSHSGITYRFHGTPTEHIFPPQRQPDVRIPPNAEARYHTASAVESTVTVMLTLARLDAAQLAPLNRGERYQTILAHADNQRTEILAWLATEGLSSGVKQISEPNTFNILFVCCTEQVADRLKQAPNVLEAGVVES